mmetsp:Transcript_38354/g.63715  ORF Transcript_38354/g.63715 Transcript_38354/m.63715 type:complete len:200 (+) Transcript_38354:1475-2074(+)
MPFCYQFLQLFANRHPCFEFHLLFVKFGTKLKHLCIGTRCHFLFYKGLETVGDFCKIRGNKLFESIIAWPIKYHKSCVVALRSAIIARAKDSNDHVVVQDLIATIGGRYLMRPHNELQFVSLKERLCDVRPEHARAFSTHSKRLTRLRLRVTPKSVHEHHHVRVARRYLQLRAGNRFQLREGCTCDPGQAAVNHEHLVV